ncbi:MAG: proline dehydrogenase [Dactylosporangium sp.]|nr:proline dehydrogenase family protein [Dactylosporangium sp.]NNJ63437.1 proline dehydrogenase [Dactylosporangium sp.]
MKLWQTSMIRLARSERITGFVQRRRRLSSLAARFVGGHDGASAVATAHGLRAEGITASLYYLGEYVRDPAIIASTIGTLSGSAAALGAEGLDTHVSIDPTQVGLMVSEERCAAHLGQLAAAVTASRPGHDALMLDMEDAGTTEATLRLHDQLRAAGRPTAITLQAYLHRTAADLDRLASVGAWVRLVKGAFAEPAAIAARRSVDIDERYRRGAEALLAPSSRAAGCYPSFATHDERLIDDITAMAARQGCSSDAFEFELLHGVRPELQRRLVARGFRVRVYVPFGVDWFPYTIRRVGESARNVRFAARAVAGRSG